MFRTLIGQEVLAREEGIEQEEGVRDPAMRGGAVRNI